MITAADVLEKAAEHVRAGWTQSQPFHEVDGKVYCCASGAIWLAAGLSVEQHETSHMMWSINWDQSFELWYQVLQRLSDHVGDYVPDWNDSLGQTQDRVVDTMLRLAKELRNNETP